MPFLGRQPQQSESEKSQKSNPITLKGIRKTGFIWNGTDWDLLIKNGSDGTDGADGTGDSCDSCSLDSLDDADEDGIRGDIDNCPAMPNRS